MGYTGGSTRNPTYYNLADHTESVQFDYDPAKVSYEELVAFFFVSHDATRARKNQYMSAIFVDGEEQARIAHAVMSRVQGRLQAAIQTRVNELADFYLAEDYHQKYALQGDTLLSREFKAMYPDIWELVDSSAATRVNAYLYGCGSAEQLNSEIDSLGLSDAGKNRLRSATSRTACRV